MAGMRRAGDFGEAHRQEGGLVLDQFHPRLQFQCRQTARPGTGFRMVDQAPRQPLTTPARRDGQLAQIQGVGLRRQHDTGDDLSLGAVQDPDLARPGQGVQPFGRQIAQG